MTAPLPPHDEMISLLNAVTHSYQPLMKPDAHHRDVLADWLRDHPEMAAELLAAMLERLPGLMNKVLQSHLSVTAHQEKNWLNGREILTRTRINIMFDGVVIGECAVEHLS